MRNSPRSSLVSRKAAAAELLARRKARTSLLDFTQYTFPAYLGEPAHRLIADTLDQVVKGEIDRLMIFAPPQSGKSELASVRFPAHWLGRRPEDPIILSSYGASLAIDKSRQARDIVISDEYRRVFKDIELRDGSTASDHWKIAGHRGYMKAAGVGGPITGHGAMLGIIDDPFENWAQAQSKTIREMVWAWYRGTFRTRIWEHGAIILIMTRWHQDDLAGRLLNTPDRWTVLRLPALAETQEERDENNIFLKQPTGQPDPLGREPGEPLTPLRLSKPAVLEIKSDVGTMVFGSEYQGVPKLEGGNRVKQENLPIVGSAPAKARRVRYWDKAGSDGEGDYTVGVLMAEAGGTYYIEDVVRGQWELFDRQLIILQTAIMDTMQYGAIQWRDENYQFELPDPALPAQERADLLTEMIEKLEVTTQGPDIWIEREGGSSGKDAAKAETKLLAGFKVKTEAPQGSKEVRAEPFIAQTQGGNVRLVAGAWNRAYIEEMTLFPNGEHDDQWDSTSGAFRKLARPRVKVYAGVV